MKKFLLASSFAVAVAGSAFAADMSPPPPVLKAPPPPPPSWSGCYLDAGVGYGMYNQDTTSETFPGLVPTTELTTLGGRGWLGRFGGGCDYQFGVPGLGNFVIGAFGDYDFMNLNGTWEDDFFLNSGPEKETGAWYAGARLGYVVAPNLLTYVDGGWTGTHFDAINAVVDAPPFGPGGFFVPSHTYSGWFVGGGTEYALNFSWLPIHGLFWRNEYRYAEYQSADLPFLSTTTGAPNGSGDHFQKFTQTITSSLVWRFNWGSW
jgi:outer membrane immunogenic protein